MKLLLALLLLIPPLTACDALKDRMGIPIPEKVEAEGKAIGSACRHAGRGLEDCFRLNPQADKAAVHTGWKEMNEYMLKNNMQSIPPEYPASLPGKAAKSMAHEPDEEDGAHATGTKNDQADAHADNKASAKDAAKDTTKGNSEKTDTEDKKKSEAKTVH